MGLARAGGAERDGVHRTQLAPEPRGLDRQPASHRLPWPLRTGQENVFALEKGMLALATGFVCHLRNRVVKLAELPHERLGQHVCAVGEHLPNRKRQVPIGVVRTPRRAHGSQL